MFLLVTALLSLIVIGVVLGMYPLSQSSVITEGNGAVAAGTGTTNGTVVDMEGFDGVMFIVQVGTVVAGGTLTLNCMGAAVNTGGTVTEATTGATSPAANNVVVLDVLRPTNRFQNPQIVIATQNIQILSVETIRYRARSLPTTPDATAITTTAIVN